MSLKSALSVLGVSHGGLMHNGEEHNIFMLGLDAEDLREVVRSHDFGFITQLPCGTCFLVSRKWREMVRLLASV